jgi:hypothetical protein
VFGTSADFGLGNIKWILDRGNGKGNRSLSECAGVAEGGKAGFGD